MFIEKDAKSSHTHTNCFNYIRYSHVQYTFARFHWKF